MLAVGVSLLVVGVAGFLAVCTFVAVRIPKWSARGWNTGVRSSRFLVFRFRLDSWWYGVPLMARGLLISLPIALATDFPPVQVMFVTLILFTFSTVQTRAWPWKVPLLNVVDCVMSFCVVMLVVASALRIKPMEDSSMEVFASAFSTAFSVMIAACMVSLFLATFCAFIFRSALGGQKELPILNLTRLPSPDAVSTKLMSIASDLANMNGEAVSKAIGAMGTYDVKQLLAVMTLMVVEIVGQNTSAKGVELVARLSSSSFGAARISSASFRASVAPSKLQQMASVPAEESNTSSISGEPSEDEMGNNVRADSQTAFGFREPLHQEDV